MSDADALSPAAQHRAAALLAGIYAARMLGMFMIFPVFSLYAVSLSGYTPALVGVALGIYGLTQGLLQIPMGKLSDHFGRKRIIMIGLLFFLAGSLLAAAADHMYTLIAARALQGCGAISAVCLAYATDLSSETQRGKVMAIIGAAIGISFIVSLIIGPLLARWVDVRGLFLISAALALVSLLANQALPSGQQISAAPPDAAVLDRRAFALASFSVFCLHLTLTACFVVLPHLLLAQGWASEHHWYVYLPLNVLALLLMRFRAPAHPLRYALDFFILALGFACLLGHELRSLLIVGSALFFIGFYRLEAGLPTWASLLAPGNRRGVAMGVFSTLQFIGSFAGGVLAGLLWQHFDTESVFVALLLISAILSLLILHFSARQNRYNISLL